MADQTSTNHLARLSGSGKVQAGQPMVQDPFPDRFNAILHSARDCVARVVSVRGSLEHLE